MTSNLLTNRILAIIATTYMRLSASGAEAKRLRGFRTAR
jgi:hypothetical protein